jgi:DNA-binding CsgD family transcriptional regulator
MRDSTRLKRMKGQAPPQSVIGATRFIGLMHANLDEISKISRLTGFCDIDLDDEDRATKNEFLLSIAAYMANAHIALLLKTTYEAGIIAVALEDLTGRQLEIMAQIKSHKTNKEIATVMGFSESTIHHEVTKLLQHFSVTNRADLSSARDKNELG